MKLNINGIIREMTNEEIEQYAVNFERLPYEERVVRRIREVYTIDDEIAILRQRDTKPDEFREYNRVVEDIKAEERGK